MEPEGQGEREVGGEKELSWGRERVCVGESVHVFVGGRERDEGRGSEVEALKGEANPLLECRKTNPAPLGMIPNKGEPKTEVKGHITQLVQQNLENL